MPTPRPEPDLVRRTVRVIVAAVSGLRFSLRLGEDGWVQVREHGPTEEPNGDSTLWPMLLRGLVEAEAVVTARAERGTGGGNDSPGGTAGSIVRPEVR